MSKGHSVSTAGIRLHQFVAGALPAIAYLLGWAPPVWVSLALSVLALASDRLAIVVWLLRGRQHIYSREDPGPRRGLFRLDELMRVVLLGTGLSLLHLNQPLGWMPILAAAAIGLLESTTAFSFMLLAYTGLKLALGRLYTDPPDEEADEADHGNPNCVVCKTLQAAPYGRCHWCRLSGIRWCCGLQSSLLMVLLLVIAFLLNAAMEPVTTKILVSLSIVGLVALSLAVSRQTDDLIGTLNNLNRERMRFGKRCEFLKRLALADTIQEAAEAAVACAAEVLDVGRASVMILEDGKLHIVASRGIPAEVAARVEVAPSERTCGRVFTTGTPVVLGDVGTQAPGQSLGLASGGPAATYPLVAAMETANRKVGVLNVTDRADGAFTPEDLAELGFLAEATAISLSSQLDRRELDRANYATIRALATAIEAKDDYTHGHSVRVQVWATAVAREMGLEGARLQALTYAAELHDIGKIAIPDEILKAPRKLSASEWAVVQQHPRRGLEMIRHLSFLQATAGAILHHHEKLDGSGYPDGLAGDEIPLEARIMAVVDAYDAMTSARPYRPALSHEQAAAELHTATGSQFDAQVVAAFLHLVEGAQPQAVGVEAWSTEGS